MSAAPRFLGIGHLVPQPDWQMAVHSHQFHELIVVLAGKLHVDIRGQMLHAGAGDLLRYPAGVLHQEQSDQQAPCETLFLSWDGPAAPPTWPLCQADTQNRITELARWLWAERGSHYPERQTLRDAFLNAILAEYHRLATHKEDELVARLRVHIRQHLARPITLDQLATVAGLSKFHFVRRYRALTGRTPMADLRSVRLAAVRDLLLTTDLTLKEIAPRCGLRDEYHLSRLFQKHFHTSPGRLRR